MKISERTKISEVIRLNSDSIDVIVSISKHFEKLRNPILRKLLAPRVTIAEAAKIGKCEVTLFLNKLKSIGFEIELPDNKLHDLAVSQSAGHSEFIQDLKVVDLDVREDLRLGKDPFKKIMDSLASIDDYSCLKVINTFEPIPLIRILEKKGYRCFVETNESVINTFIRRSPGTDTVVIVEHHDNGKESLNEKLLNFEDRVVKLDVRNMEMPGPMIAILESLKSLSPDHALYIDHKKVPQFLLPDLIELNYSYLIEEVSPSLVKMLIWK